MTRVASLFYTWDELEALARLVDAEVARLQWGDPAWAMLNSLRTSLREAQFTINPDEPVLGDDVIVHHDQGYEPGQVVGTVNVRPDETLVYTIEFADGTRSTWSANRVRKAP